MPKKLENEARQVGCHVISLDSFSFQAADFYKKQGYSEFGRIKNYPKGHSQVFLEKRL